MHSAASCNHVCSVRCVRLAGCGGDGAHGGGSSEALWMPDSTGHGRSHLLSASGTQSADPKVGLLGRFRLPGFVILV